MKRRHVLQQLAVIGGVGVGQRYTKANNDLNAVIDNKLNQDAAEKVDSDKKSEDNTVILDVRLR